MFVSKQQPGDLACYKHSSMHDLFIFDGMKNLKYIALFLMTKYCHTRYDNISTSTETTVTFDLVQ